MNELPMYGGGHVPEVEKNRKFSESAAKLGWQYFYKGDLDAAIKRFNQAWMFDPESSEAYWGFGVIMGRRSLKEETEKNLAESIRFLEMALERAPQSARIMVDLAYSRTFLGKFLGENSKKGNVEQFEKASKLYEAAEKLEPKYPLLYGNWSVLNFYCGKYVLAKELLTKAKELGYSPNPAYEQDLESKLAK